MCRQWKKTKAHTQNLPLKSWLLKRSIDIMKLGRWAHNGAYEQQQQLQTANKNKSK